jgi:hypothetical protein
MKVTEEIKEKWRGTLFLTAIAIYTVIIINIFIGTL